MDSLMDLCRTYHALPGELKMCVYLLTALVLVSGTLSIPINWLIGVGCTKYGTPNWITIWRFPLFILGLVLFFAYDFYFIGVQILTVALLMDRLDGKVAELIDKFAKVEIKYPERDEGEGKWSYAYRKFKIALYHPGSTEEGAVLDAFVDKCKVLPTLTIFAFVGLLSWPMVLLMVCFDAIGTLIRPPFRFGQRFVRTGKATAVGKIKFFFQCVLMFACLEEYMHLLEIPSIGAWGLSHLDSILALALVFGFLSIVSRLNLGKGVNRAVDRVTTRFAHTSVQRE